LRSKSAQWLDAIVAPQLARRTLRSLPEPYKGEETFMGGLSRTATVADTLEQGLAMHASSFLSTCPALLHLRQSRALGTPRSRLLGVLIFLPIIPRRLEHTHAATQDSRLTRAPHHSSVLRAMFFGPGAFIPLSLNDRRHCATPGRTCASPTHPPTSCPASSFAVATRDSWFGDTKTHDVLSRRNQTIRDVQIPAGPNDALRHAPPVHHRQLSAPWAPRAKKRQWVSLTLASLGRFTRGLSRKSDEKCQSGGGVGEC
jgi:hypothetical protein